MKIVIFLSFIFSVNVFADSTKFQVKLTDLTNLARSSAIEACGIATHADGKKPLLVTITHDQSKYTTVTDESGNWCLVFKRWTGSGKISIIAATMDFSEKSSEVLINNLRGN